MALQPAFPQGNIQESEACSCCREGTGTHTFLVPKTLSSFLILCRSAQVLSMTPRFELLGMHETGFSQT